MGSKWLGYPLIRPEVFRRLGDPSQERERQEDAWGLSCPSQLLYLSPLSGSFQTVLTSTGTSDECLPPSTRCSLPLGLGRVLPASFGIFRVGQPSSLTSHSVLHQRDICGPLHAPVLCRVAWTRWVNLPIWGSKNKTCSRLRAVMGLQRIQSSSADQKGELHQLPVVDCIVFPPKGVSKPQPPGPANMTSPITRDIRYMQMSSRSTESIRH